MVGHKATVSHGVQTEEDSLADPADGFIVVSRKTREVKPVAPNVSSARKHIRIPKHQTVIIDNPTGATSYADMIPWLSLRSV